MLSLPKQELIYILVDALDDIIAYIKSFVHSGRKTRRWRTRKRNWLFVCFLRKQMACKLYSLPQSLTLTMHDCRFQQTICQFDRLCRSLPASIRSTIADLPKSLDKTYEQTLLRIDREKRQHANVYSSASLYSFNHFAFRNSQYSRSSI